MNEMDLVFLEGLSVNKDVVKIRDTELVKEYERNIIYVVLE